MKRADCWKKACKQSFRLEKVGTSKDGCVINWYVQVADVTKKMEEAVEKRRAYEKEWKRTFRDRINAKRRERYAMDDKFRQKERERVRKATKPWSELSEKEKERKRKWQREYQKRRYHEDAEFRRKQKEKTRKSSTGFMKFGGYKAGNHGKGGK